MADINSNLPVVDTADGTPGAAAPSIAQQVGGTDGTNLRVLSLDSTGKLNINNISGTISLPSGAATSALQTTGNSSLSSIDGKLNSLGQKTMANSVPVVLASDQSTLAISAASLPLPSGAATSALQTTGNTSIASIDTKTPTVGQKTMANSSPVVLASDQSAIPVSQSGSWTVTANAGTNLNTSALATSANQTNASQKTQLVDGSGNVIGSITNQLSVNQIANNSGVQGAVTVGTSAVQANVSGSNLTNRKNLVIYNNSLVNMFWGYTSGVTTSSGVPLLPATAVSLDIGSGTTVFLIAGTASNNSRVAEVA